MTGSEIIIIIGLLWILGFVFGWYLDEKASNKRLDALDRFDILMEYKPKEETPKPKEKKPKPKEETPKTKEETPKPKEEKPKPKEEKPKPKAKKPKAKKSKYFDHNKDDNKSKWPAKREDSKWESYRREDSKIRETTRKLENSVSSSSRDYMTW